jgi:hypothetical protein
MNAGYVSVTWDGLGRPASVTTGGQRPKLAVQRQGRALINRDENLNLTGGG